MSLLLVDSEGPFSETKNIWAFLNKRDGWKQPEGATDGHVYLMVECMESWFLADRDCLNKYFGQGFNKNALLGNTDIETISKADVFKSLKDATRQAKIKGEYGKGKHSFEILAELDSEKVYSASPHAKRLIDKLKKP